MSHGGGYHHDDGTGVPPVNRRWEPDEAHIDRVLPLPQNNPGGRKDDSGKLRWDLLPVRPLEFVVQVYTIGAKKYNDRNWEKGISYCRIFGAMMRHAWAWFRGEKYDPVDGQHHLASVVWCCLALMQYELTRSEFDDRVIEPLANTPMVITGTGGTDGACVSERPNR